jgi:hypothetical protein
MEDPIVSPLNSMIAMGGIPTYGMSGFFKAISTSSHSELWRVTLIGENSGNLVPDSRPRFAPDGQTVYITAQILGGDQTNLYGYVYALDASASPAGCSSNCLRSKNISLTAGLRFGSVTPTGRVTVKNENGLAIRGAMVAVTWTLPGGATQSQVVTTNASGVATFKTSGNHGTYTLAVTNIAKAGYTFDPTNSILTMSITR